MQVALRTQQIIAHESGVADTVDPLAGSYVIEHLTDEIERHACDYIERIDAMGGALRAIEAGFVQGEINDAAYAYQRAVESGDQVVVGVNKFATDGEQVRRARDFARRSGHRSGAARQARGSSARNAITSACAICWVTWSQRRARHR